MGWSQLVKKELDIPKPEDFFTPLQRIKHTGGLKVGIYGKPETGKTYFALTCPPPVYVIDTEFAAKKVARVHFPEKRIFIAEVTHIDPITDQPDPIRSLENVEKAIAAIASTNIERGTIVIDTVTDIWQWICAWLEQVATRRTQSGQPYRFEYGLANERYRQIIVRLLAKPVHVVLTAHESPIYDEKGQEIPGLTQGKWQKQTPHWVDIVLHAQKRFNASLKRWQYVTTIEKCRFKRGLNAQIEDITFQKLVNFLRQNLGVDVA